MKIKILILTLLFLSRFLHSYSQFEKTQAVFIYNFTRYIEWPEDYKKGDFVIGILGNSILFDHLTAITKVKKVVDQSIVIKIFNKPEDITKCNILFISNHYSNKISQAINQLKNSSTLIIGTQPGLTRNGAALNFILVNNRQKFELNESNLPTSLKLSSGLKNLAIIVNN